ncbi:MAG: sulfur carrier protein ThiS [Lentisphaerae bacterium]|nr:sulfur carrier protein ThiS [Lentisphaerota bacterium]MCP4102836.1 sulfur carrier protein ThiS [Lentisphaerota bacterium]
MKISFNGNELEITANITLVDFMDNKNLVFEHTLIELNGKILSKEEKHEAILSDGDNVAAFTLVSGG